MKRISFVMYFSLGLLLLACQISSFAQTPPAPTAAPDLPAQYAATAIGQAGSAAGKSFGLKIYVEGMTSDGEVSELVSVLKNKGQDGLVSAMEKMNDKGRIAPDGGVGTGMRVVRVRPTKDGGQHIVLATNRPISFPELYNATRSTQYKIGIVVLDVDKDGKERAPSLLCARSGSTRKMNWKSRPMVRSRFVSPMCIGKNKPEGLSV